MWQEEADVWEDAQDRVVTTFPYRQLVVAPPRRYRRRSGIAARATRAARGWHFRLIRARRYAGVDLARVHGLPLLVLPGVFHPEFFLTSDFFLRYLDSWPVASGGSALDMGTGSGAIGVALALRGARVTAIDINSAAVRCARERTTS
jgi:methylase of polypeptide subunit release factors